MTRRFVLSREGSYVLVGDSYRLATVRTVGVRSVVRSAESLAPSAESSGEVPNRQAKCRTVTPSAEPSSGARGQTRQVRTPSAHLCGRGPVEQGTKTTAAHRQWQQSQSSTQMTPTAPTNQRKPAPPTDNNLANPATTTPTAAPTPTTTPTNRKNRFTTPVRCLLKGSGPFSEGLTGVVEDEGAYPTTAPWPSPTRSTLATLARGRPRRHEPPHPQTRSAREHPMVLPAVTDCTTFAGTCREPGRQNRMISTMCARWLLSGQVKWCNQ